MVPKIELPPKVAPLFKPKRYKGLKGGRGSAKSHSMARIHLIRAMESPRRILCCREFQNSIGESVHQLLSDVIYEYNLESFFTIKNNSIVGINGSEFFFMGLRHNIQSIKSLEGITDVWIEEAQVVSKASWDILVPTIREMNSEIWFTFNPELETDETYQRFVVNPPGEKILETNDVIETTMAIVITMNYMDNPWFPEVLENERVALMTKDMDSYMHVWEGKCRQALAGAIYEKQLNTAELENRITSVPYDQTVPVHCYWDIGRADLTTIWFIQRVGFEYHVIDYYENNMQDEVKFYADALRGKGYTYGVQWLPHDAKAKRLGTKLSVEEQLRAFNFDVRIVPNIGIYDGIMALRAVFNRMYFDKQKTADGLNAVRHYRYGINDTTGEKTNQPVHDWASHASDALRMFAVSSRKIEEKPRKTFKPRPKRGYGRV